MSDANKREKFLNLDTRRESDEKKQEASQRSNQNFRRFTFVVCGCGPQVYNLLYGGFDIFINQLFLYLYIYYRFG